MLTFRIIGLRLATRLELLQSFVLLSFTSTVCTALMRNLSKGYVKGWPFAPHDLPVIFCFGHSRGATSELSPIHASRLSDMILNVERGKENAFPQFKTM